MVQLCLVTTVIKSKKCLISPVFNFKIFEIFTAGAKMKEPKWIGFSLA
jgi:hypothetical protein